MKVTTTIKAGTRVDREQSMQDKFDNVEDKLEIPR